MKNWPEVLDRLAIRPYHQFVRTSGKNATDIAMVIDAMDMFHAEDFDAFAIVSSDSDFTGLASRLKTPVSFRNACDDFILTEDLGATAASSVAAPSGDGSLRMEAQDIVALLKAAASEHSESKGWTLTSHACNVIKRQRPDFSPRQFGCKTLGQVIAKFDRYFELRRVTRGDGMTDQFMERPAQA